MKKIIILLCLFCTISSNVFLQEKTTQKIIGKWDCIYQFEYTSNNTINEIGEISGSLMFYDNGYGFSINYNGKKTNYIWSYEEINNMYKIISEEFKIQTYCYFLETYLILVAIQNDDEKYVMILKRGKI